MFSTTSDIGREDYKVLIEKSVPRVTVWYYEAPDQYLELMIDSFSCTPMGADA